MNPTHLEYSYYFNPTIHKQTSGNVLWFNGDNGSRAQNTYSHENFSPPGSSVHGFFWQENWSGLPFLLQGIFPRIKLTSLISPALANLFFTTSATWEAPETSIGTLKWQLTKSCKLIKLDIKSNQIDIDWKKTCRNSMPFFTGSFF